MNFSRFSCSILTCFLSSITTLSSAIIQLEEGCVCGCTEPVIRGYLNHIEPGGIGYNKGYTTLGLFFAPFQPIHDCVSPFFDFRGHVFNDAKYALNAGLGLRFLDCRLWGVNAYYDFRHSSCHNYNQIGLGLESLGQRWDFRINGYLPVGDKTCIKKSDHELKKEFAMSGLDGEIGVTIAETCNGYLYLAGGPYWLHHESKNGWGGKFRLATLFLRYLTLEGDISHDTIFKTKGQGQIGINIPFGPRYEVIKRCGFSCSKTMLQRKIALRDVERKEIIVLKKHHEKIERVHPLIIENTPESENRGVSENKVEIAPIEQKQEILIPEDTKELDKKKALNYLEILEI